MAWLALLLSSDWRGGTGSFIPAVHAGCLSVFACIQRRLMWPCCETQLREPTLEHLSYQVGPEPFSEPGGDLRSCTADKRAGLAEVCTPGVELPQGGHPEHYK